jgi:hypothetical protein
VCPFCAEPLPEGAERCPACGERLGRRRHLEAPVRSTLTSCFAVGNAGLGLACFAWALAVVLKAGIGAAIPPSLIGLSLLVTAPGLWWQQRWGYVIAPIGSFLACGLLGLSEVGLMVGAGMSAGAASPKLFVMAGVIGVLLLYFLAQLVHFLRAQGEVA